MSSPGTDFIRNPSDTVKFNPVRLPLENRRCQQAFRFSDRCVLSLFSRPVRHGVTLVRVTIFVETFFLSYFDFPQTTVFFMQRNTFRTRKYAFKWESSDSNVFWQLFFNYLKKTCSKGKTFFTTVFKIYWLINCSFARSDIFEKGWFKTRLADFELSEKKNPPKNRY